MDAQSTPGSENPLAPFADAWAEPQPELDERALAERAQILTVDRRIRVLARANRLALSRGRVERHRAGHAGADTFDIPLR